MEPGYRVDSSALGGSSRRAAIVVAVATLFIATVLVKPWDGPATTSSASSGAAAPVVGDVTARATGGSATPPAIIFSVTPVPAYTPGWPIPSDGDLAGGDPSVFADMLAGLTSRAGVWGVGDVGAGPRLIRDEPWADWVGVEPEPATSAPTNIGIWPGTSVCHGLPILADRPTVLAITALGHLPSGWMVDGWWTDGSSVARLAGSVRDVTPPETAGIGYVARIDGRPWPSGRYEFHVADGGSVAALTFCVGRTG